MIKAILFAAATVASGHVRSDVRIPADVRQMPEAVSRLSQKAKDVLHSVTSQPNQFQEAAFLHLAERLSDEGIDFGGLINKGLPIVQGLATKLPGLFGRKPEQLQEAEQSDDEKKFNWGGLAQTALGAATKFGPKLLGALGGRQGADGSDQSVADQFTQGVEKMQPDEKVELLESLASHLQSVSDSVASVSKMPIQAQQSVILGLLENVAQHPQLDEKSKKFFMDNVKQFASSPLGQAGMQMAGKALGGLR